MQPINLAGPLRAVRKYSKILRVSLIERMTYRGDFFLSTILRFLPMVTTILLWQAIYAGTTTDVLPAVGASTVGLLGSPPGQGPLLATSALSSGGTQLSGFSLREMIAYLLLVHISRMFSSMPGLSGGIARDIREGTLKKYLIQPLDMIGYLVSYRVAHKAAYIVTSSLPYALLFFLCRDFFDGFPDAPTFAGYVAALLMGFLVGFFSEASLGMVGFWFLEVTSLLYVVNTINFFVSGQMFPLDLLPPFWVAVLKALPFQYLAYFPAAVFLGKVRGWDLVYGLLGQAAWVLFFIALSRWLYRRGLRRYSAFGG